MVMHTETIINLLLLCMVVMLGIQFTKAFKAFVQYSMMRRRKKQRNKRRRK